MRQNKMPNWLRYATAIGMAIALIWGLSRLAYGAAATPLKSGTVAPKEFQSGDTIANSFLDTLVIISTEIDTIAEIEALAAAVNIIINTEIDTYAELDTLSDLPTVTTGDLLYGSASNVLSALADVATGSYLASGGVGVAPSWAVLNQAAVAGLTTASSPQFAKLGLGMTSVNIIDILTTSNGDAIKISSNQDEVWLNLTNTDTSGRVWLIGSVGGGTALGAGNLVFRDATGGTNPLIMNASGNLGMGTISFGTGAVRVLTLANGTAPGALANTASIVALTGELYGVDAAGNQTLNSPHKAEILDLSNPVTSPYPWVYYAKNPYLGKEVLVNMAEVIAEVEKLSNKKFITYRDLPIIEKRDWSTDQNENILKEKERLIAEKRTEKVEVTDVVSAFEDIEIMEEVASGTTKTVYMLDNTNKKIVSKSVPVMIKQGTGKFETHLKSGYRFEEKTGKIYRKKTRLEAENEIVAPSPVAPPKWMRDRGVN